MSDSNFTRTTATEHHGTHHGTTGTTTAGGHAGTGDAHGTGTTHVEETDTHTHEHQQQTERKEAMNNSSSPILAALTICFLFFAGATGYANTTNAFTTEKDITEFAAGTTASFFGTGSTGSNFSTDEITAAFGSVTSTTGERTDIETKSSTRTASDGQTFDGPTFDGPTFGGQTFDGQTFSPSTFGGVGAGTVTTDRTFTGGETAVGGSGTTSDFSGVIGF